MTHLTVLKLGGELLEEAESLNASAKAIVRLSQIHPLVVVHGGGRAIDAELRARGVAPRFVDGLRITDDIALDAVVTVLAGRTNTSLVSAVGSAGGRAIGLTGADGAIGLSRRAPRFQAVSGEQVDLGLVGEPEASDLSLLHELLDLRRVPIICSIGVDRTGTLLNVNADVMAAHLAVGLGACRLVIAGTTPGVLNGAGETIADLDVEEIAALAATGAAHSGMITKLKACATAVLGGVRDVCIVAARGITDPATAGTRVVARALA